MARPIFLDLSDYTINSRELRAFHFTTVLYYRNINLSFMEINFKSAITFLEGYKTCELSLINAGDGTKI